MSHKVLKLLLVDEGMNTGFSEASKIGGGQIAARRFFASTELFETTLLTSDPEVAQFWKRQATIIYAPEFRTYRPFRVKVASGKVNPFSLIRDGLIAVRILDKYLSFQNYDVVFLNDNKSRIIYIFYRILYCLKQKSNLTAIVVDGEWKIGFFDVLIKNLYLLTFDKIICPTHTVKRNLGIFSRLFTEKLFSSYPGVECPKEAFVDKAKNKQKHGYVFGCIGTLRTAIKGQDIIIKAVHRLIAKNRHIPLKINFYGDGPDELKLKDMISELRLEKYFEFKGYVTDQECIYNEIDACIIASRTEVAPLVLMECIVRQIPVLSSDIDGCCEILSKFYDDLIFEKENVGDLTSRIELCFKTDIINKLKRRLYNTDHTFITRDFQLNRVFHFLST